MNINNEFQPITLAFRNKALEEAFSEAALSSTLYQGRFAIIVGSFVFTLTAILDQWFVPPEHAAEVWTTRLIALCVPTLVFAVSFTPWFRRLRNLLLAAVGMTAGVGVMSMQSFLPVEGAAYFYPAMSLATFFTYNFVGTSFVYALCVDLLLVCIYNLVFGHFVGYPLHILASHDFLIVSANLVGGSAGYLAERQRRLLFLRERELARANQAKSKFLAAASHDLRQPIHAQGLFLEALACSGLSATQDAILSSVRAASEASAGMLNTLLDFSRVEAGVVEPQIRSFHLQPLLTRIENELAPQANAKGLVYRSRETHAAVESDLALVELILRNLISNAIRYTEHGGVLVACRARGEQVLLEVWDTGIGIEPSQQREIFREFHQLGNPERDRNKGLGLGLAIAQGLARVLGHELSLASTPGHGSVFRLILPIARAAVVSDDMETAHSHARVLDLRVLVIDDDEAVRAGMAQLLRGWDCACVAVESIAEAKAAARACRPDIVISDYRLREHRTGVEAIAALRAEFGADLPALLITGDTAPERLREARASGVPLLHKPVSPSLLYRRLESMLPDTKAIAPTSG